MSNNNAPLFYGALPMVKQAKKPVPPVPAAPAAGDIISFLNNPQNSGIASNFADFQRDYNAIVQDLTAHGVDPKTAQRVASTKAMHVYGQKPAPKPVELNIRNGAKATFGKMGRGVKGWAGRNKLGLALGALGLLGAGASYAGYKARPGLDALGNGLDTIRQGWNGGAPQQPAAATTPAAPQTPAAQPQAAAQREPLSTYDTQQYDVGGAIKRIANGYGPLA